jgi:protoporphyrinogen oxidase
VLAPYSEKVWKTPPAEISATAAEVRVSAGSLTKMARRILSGGREKAGEETALRRFRYLKGGVESLVRRLAERVTAVGGEIRCDCRVERLICKGDGAWQVHHTQGEIGANAVISTIPVTHLPGLLRGDGFPTPPKESVEALVYLEIVLVFLVIERAQVSENHWLYFPDADICFNRGYEPSRFSDDPEKPPNQTLLCLEITARPNSALLKSTDEDLRVLVRRDLARTGLVKEEEVGKSFVVRLPFGYPLYDRHADENLARVLDCLRRWPGLVTTGRQGIFSHNNMDHSMHMGIEAARALAAGAEGQARWYDGVEGLRHFRIVD